LFHIQNQELHMNNWNKDKTREKRIFAEKKVLCLSLI